MQIRTWLCVPIKVLFLFSFFETKTCIQSLRVMKKTCPGHYKKVKTWLGGGGGGGIRH